MKVRCRFVVFNGWSPVCKSWFQVDSKTLWARCTRIFILCVLVLLTISVVTYERILFFVLPEYSNMHMLGFHVQHLMIRCVCHVLVHELNVHNLALAARAIGQCFGARSLGYPIHKNRDIIMFLASHVHWKSKTPRLCIESFVWGAQDVMIFCSSVSTIPGNLPHKSINKFSSRACVDNPLCLNIIVVIECCL